LRMDPFQKWHIVLPRGGDPCTRPMRNCRSIRMDTVIGTVPVVGATGGRPREPLEFGLSHGLARPYSPAPRWPWVRCFYAQRRATAGRPYRWDSLRILPRWWKCIHPSEDGAARHYRDPAAGCGRPPVADNWRFFRPLRPLGRLNLA